MKLITYIHQGAAHLGAIHDSQVIDLAQAYLEYREDVGALTRPGGLPQDMLALLQAGGEMLSLLEDIVQWAGALPPSARLSFRQPLAEVQLAAPLSNPSKIICVGLNYMDHCLEAGLEVTDRPILFAKFPSSIVGPDEEIAWPPDASEKVDYEVELAVIIGRRGRNIPADQAYDYVAGYTIANDVSARDAQFSDKQWVRGKSFDTFCPLGPYLLTTDELPDPHHLRVRAWINGELRQDSNTQELVFKVPDLMAYISKTSTLMPGDVLLTSTPGGVGVFRDPQVFLQAGDLIEMEIEDLGRLRNRVG